MTHRTTLVLAKKLDWTSTYFRQIMWNHGFDSVVDWRGEVWLIDEFQQMLAERIRWGFLKDFGDGQYEKDTAQIKRRLPVEPVAKYEPPVTREQPQMTEAEREAYHTFAAKCAAHEEYNRRVRDQLKSVPVSAQDLDYLATRAGERRRRGDTSGVTTLIVQREKNK